MDGVVIKPLGWYRDKQDALWMDAEPIAGTTNFTLYRSGAGPRIYTTDGHCLKDGDHDPHPGCDLAFEITREGPVAPLSETTPTSDAKENIL